MQWITDDGAGSAMSVPAGSGWVHLFSGLPFSGYIYGLLHVSLVIRMKGPNEPLLRVECEDDRIVFAGSGNRIANWNNGTTRDQSLHYNAVLPNSITGGTVNVYMSGLVTPATVITRGSLL